MEKKGGMRKEVISKRKEKIIFRSGHLQFVGDENRRDFVLQIACTSGERRGPS